VTFPIVVEAWDGQHAASLVGVPTDFQRLHILSYTPQAESLYQEWRQQGIRLATHDLRIAAICVVHAAPVTIAGKIGDDAREY
jgi:predicted nucleic acid-binding protein